MITRVRFLQLIQGFALFTLVAVASAQQIATTSVVKKRAAEIATIKPSAQELTLAKKLKVEPAELKEFVYGQRHHIKPLDFRKPIFSQAQLQQILGSHKALTTSCDNGGLELGDLSYWLGSTGTITDNGTVQQFYLTPLSTTGFNTSGGPSVAQHAVLPITGWGGWNGPQDPTVAAQTPNNQPPIPLPFPLGGSHWMRLGNPGINYGAEAVALPVTVSISNPTFGFEYAVVQQDPGSDHQPYQKPIMAFQLLDQNSNVIDSFSHVANIADSFYANSGTSGSGVVWRRVSCYRRDLSAYVGQTVTAVFYNADCTKGAHFGYTYIDRVCDATVGKPILTGLNGKYCEQDPIYADGSQSQGVTQYKWTISQLDGNGAPVVGTTKSQAYTGAISGQFFASSWYVSKGGQLTCGHKYRITLSILTECAINNAWESVSQDIFIDCCKPVDCCTETPLVAPSKVKLKPINVPGQYQFIPTVSWGGNAARVEVTLENSAIGPTPTTLQPVYGYITNPGGVSGFTNPQYGAFPFARDLYWESPGVSMASGKTLAMRLNFPSYSTPQYLRFTVKYTVYDINYTTCEMLQTYEYTVDPGRAPVPIDPIQLLAVSEGSGQGELKGGQNSTRGNNKMAKPHPDGSQTGTTLQCCLQNPIKVAPASIRNLPNNTTFAFSPLVTWAGTAYKAEVTVVNAVRSPLSVPATNIPIFGYINAAGNVTGFGLPQLIASPYSNGVRWISGGVNLSSGAYFPLKLEFPQPIPGQIDFLMYTLKYEFWGNNCQSCFTYVTYRFKSARNGYVPINDWPVKDGTTTTTSGGGNGGGITVKIGGGKNGKDPRPVDPVKPKRGGG